MRATGLNPAGRWRQNLDQMRQFIIVFFAKAGVLDPFAGQSTFNKNSFAILARNASRLVIQRFDNPDWHGQLQKKHEF
jgi:hypothetical protein